MRTNLPQVVIASSQTPENRILTRHLQGHHFRVCKVTSQGGFLGRLKRGPDVMLLDLSLAWAEGALRHAKKGRNGRPNGTPILVFDPRRNPLKEIKAFHLGADGYLGRPQLKEEVLSVIRPYVERRGVDKHYQGLLQKEAGDKRRVEKESDKLQVELKRLTDFTEKIASNVPLSILIVDPNQRVTYVNQNFSRVANRGERFFVGRALGELFPEDLYGPVELVEKVALVLRTGRPTPRFAMRYRGDRYTYRVLPLTSRSGPERGSHQAMILIENISELKSLGERVQISEERYRALFEHSPDGIVVTQPGGGRVLDANRQAAQLLGIKKSSLRGRTFLHLLPQEMRKRAKQVLAAAIGSKERYEIPDLVMTTSGGKQGRVLAVSASHVLQRGEETLLWHLRDITEKRFLEDQVRQTEKISLLGQFTAGAAHEINNPLAIISSHAQYLVSGMSGEKLDRKAIEELRETLHLIDREARFCGGIIKNLLTYTHTREATKQAVDLASVIKNCLDMVEHQLKLSKIEIESEVDPDLPPVLGDGNLLQQVLMNLVWNAQAAMPRGGDLRIRAITCDEGRGVELAVVDTGVGIPKENLDKIFTPFFTTKGVGKGTGLGLWVVRSIIDELKGTIEVRSKINHGTEVHVLLSALATKAGGKTHYGNDSHH